MWEPDSPDLPLMPAELPQSPCPFHEGTSAQDRAGKDPCPLPGLAGRGADGHQPLVSVSTVRENEAS